MYGLQQQNVHCAGFTVALPPPFDAECACPSLGQSSDDLSK